MATRKTKPKRALKRFHVCIVNFQVLVRLLRTVEDVEREFYSGSPKKGSLETRCVNGFFAYPERNQMAPGTIVLAQESDLFDIVPHEVTHAVTRYLGNVPFESDERAASLIGRVSSQILRQVLEVR